MRQLVVVLAALVLVGCALDSPFEIDLEGLTSADQAQGDHDAGDQDSDGDNEGEGADSSQGDGGRDGDGAADDAESSDPEDESGLDEHADSLPGDAGLPDDATAALEVLRALEQPDADHDGLLTSRARAELIDGGGLAALSENSHLDVHADTWQRHNHLATVSVEVIGDDGSVQGTYLAWLLHRPIEDDWRLSGLDPVSEG